MNGPDVTCDQSQVLVLDIQLDNFDRVYLLIGAHTRLNDQI